jgi:hypothetical protein
MLQLAIHFMWDRPSPLVVIAASFGKTRQTTKSDRLSHASRYPSNRTLFEIPQQRKHIGMGREASYTFLYCRNGRPRQTPASDSRPACPTVFPLTQTAMLPLVCTSNRLYGSSHRHPREGGRAE